MKKTTSSLDRRTLLKGTALGIGALAAPAIVSRKALASSGELNFTGWAGYPQFAEKAFPAFEAATGIKIRFTQTPCRYFVMGCNLHLGIARCPSVI